MAPVNTRPLAVQWNAPPGQAKTWTIRNYTAGYLAGRTFSALWDDDAGTDDTSPTVGATSVAYDVVAPATKGRYVLRFYDTTDTPDVELVRVVVEVADSGTDDGTDAVLEATANGATFDLNLLANSAVVSDVVDAAIAALPLPADGLGTTYDDSDDDLVRFNRSGLFRLGVLAGISASTTSPLTLLTDTLTIPGGTLVDMVSASPADNVWVDMIASGFFQNNTGSSRNITFTLSLTQGSNSSTWTALFSSVATQAAQRPWSIRTQWNMADISSFTQPLGAMVTTVEGLTSSTVAASSGFGDYNLASDITVDLTVTFSAAVANFNATCWSLTTKFTEGIYQA